MIFTLNELEILSWLQNFQIILILQRQLVFLLINHQSTSENDPLLFINSITQRTTSLLFYAADKCKLISRLGKRQSNQDSNRNKQPWFNHECKIKVRPS